jgi:regulatory protein
MKITRIENSKHVQERVLVFLEEGDPLRITGHELLQFGLYPGMDLSPQLVVQLQAAGQRSESRVKAARLASGRMMSRKELTDKLSRKGIDPDTAEETADWLESLGAVDDAAYAGVIARHYAASGYGPGRVRQELQKRGVSRELWDDALSQLPDSADAIDRFLQKKLSGRTPDRATLKKLSDALLRRGFSWSDIRPALNRLGEEIDE